MSASSIKVMLVDDHAVVREGYRRLIEKHEDMTVVAEAADGAEAYQEYKQHKPDVVVLDLSMPGKGGIEVIRQLRQWHDAARILVFTMHQNAAYAIQAFQTGAKGYITKSSEPEALVSAIQGVDDVGFCYVKK
ncbi:MAG: response regulator transcription factor [Candidatus Thiodiazotropha sp.]